MGVGFGDALREWRTRRRYSQMELGFCSNVSARHISFLETGRARPSRGMVMRLCEELEVPYRSRNTLLSSAGFAPAYGNRTFSESDMTPVKSAVGWMLTRHEPFPALAMDRHWRISQMNHPAENLLGSAGIAAGDSLLDAMLENEALRSAIENLDEVLLHIRTRLRTESAHVGGDDVLEDWLGRAGELLGGEASQSDGILPPFVPTRYRLGDVGLSLLSAFSQFGTAEDIALADLRVELMFPADDATRLTLEAMAPRSNS